jgi:polyisoprenoid-binding protein YceI
MENEKFEIVAAQSGIDWVGRKVTGAHNGTIDFKSGTLYFAAGQLVGGEFTVDTTSIKILDVTDPATNDQFAGHLASDDFFSSEKYPEAKLVITSVSPVTANSYDVNADLTIKNITHEVIFTVEVNAKQDRAEASGKIIVDRTLYEMRFRSGNFFKDLGDTLIYNDFDLNVRITAKKAKQ